MVVFRDPEESRLIIDLELGVRKFYVSSEIRFRIVGDLLFAGAPREEFAPKVGHRFLPV